MPKKSIPQARHTLRVTLSGIKWETDGQRGLGLPNKVIIDIPNDYHEMTLTNVYDEAIDKASDEYGFCINTCFMDKIELG